MAATRFAPARRKTVAPRPFSAPARRRTVAPRTFVLGLLFLFSGVLHPFPAQGQQSERPAASGTISGRVLDRESGGGIANAAVRVVDLARPPILTNARGEFRLRDIPHGIQELEISHVAYGSTLQLVNVIEGATLELDFLLGYSPIALDSLVAEVEFRFPALIRSGFFERQRAGWGHYFHGEDVERWTPEQLLRLVPRVTHVQGGRSAFDRRIAFRARSPFGGTCYPDVFVDGFRFAGFEGDIRDVLGGADLVGMEVYIGTATPGEFQGRAYPPCGAIVMWTRRE